MIHQIRAENNSQAIRVAPSDTLHIELEENPTTGFAWAVEEMPPFLSVMDDRYELQRGAGIGGGGTRLLDLKVVGSGNGTIRLKNWQRWSGDVYQKFSVQVDCA